MGGAGGCPDWLVKLDISELRTTNVWSRSSREKKSGVGLCFVNVHVRVEKKINFLNKLHFKGRFDFQHMY